MSDIADDVATEAMLERLRRIDAADPQARAAINVLAPIIRELPATDDLLLAPQTAAAFSTLRDQAADTYLIYLSQVRRKCGRAVADLIIHQIGPPRSGPAREIVLLTPGQVLNRPLGSDIIEDVLPSTGVCTMIGAPGSAKSAFADHICLALAAKFAPISGRRYRPVSSVIVAAEGRRRARFQAWGDHYRVDVDALPVRIIEQGIDLRSPAGEIDRLLELLEVAKNQIGHIGIVVIDTLNRVFGGGAENDPGDMGAFLGNVQRISEQTGGVVIVAHHVGKDAAKGGRGHSSLLGAVDSQILIERQDDDTRTATVSKLRDGADGQQIAFKLQVVDLGSHPDPDAAPGTQWSSIAAVPIADQVQEPKAKRGGVPAGAKVALDALKAALTRHGVFPAGAAMTERNQMVSGEHWRAEYENMRPIADNDPEARKEKQSRRMAFKRAQDQLQSARIAATHDGNWWIQ